MIDEKDLETGAAETAAAAAGTEGVEDVTKPLDDVVIPIDAIKKTIAGVKTSDYLTKSGVYAGTIIDEIVEVNINLADVFSFVGNRRKFAIFGEVIGGEDFKILKRGDYGDYIKDLINQNTKQVIISWFNMGGVELTIINLDKVLAGDAVEVDAKNIILAGLLSTDQLLIYDKYKNYDKRFFFTKKMTDNFFDLPKARNIFIFLVSNLGTVDADIPLFDYLAKYSIDNYYNKNNFAVSNKRGLKLQSTDYLIENNIGSLIIIDENSQSIYYNIVDTAGYDMNLDFLFDDLHDKIQINVLNTLKIDNTYNQTTINRIDDAIKKAALFFVDLKRVGGFLQTLIPFKNQEVEDIKNGVVRGFVLKYQALTEIKKAKINEIEVIGELA